MERKLDTVNPTPPNVETRRKPTDEQLAHVLEITLKVEPEKNEPKLSSNLLNVSIHIHSCLQQSP